MLTSFGKSLGIPRKISQRYHQSAFKAMQIPVEIIFFSRALKPYKLVGPFKKRNLGTFLYRLNSEIMIKNFI